jgi:hypothetical protein
VLFFTLKVSQLQKLTNRRNSETCDSDGVDFVSIRAICDCIHFGVNSSFYLLYSSTLKTDKEGFPDILAPIYQTVNVASHNAV